MSHVRSLIAVTALTSATIFGCAVGTTPENGTNAGTLPPPTTVEVGSITPATTTDFQVRSDARDDWLAIAQWTHFYAITASGATADVAQAQNRLLVAGNDFATQAGVVLGDGAADPLTSLLERRAKSVIAFVGEAENGDENAMAKERASWQVASAQLATFFADKLGKAHAISALQPALFAFDAATQDEIVARAKGDFSAEVSAADQADAQALTVADTLAFSLAATYPAKLAPSTLTVENQSLRLELRSLLAQRAFWLRAFTIDQAAKREAQPELDRAIKAHVAVGDVFAGFYGKDVGDQVALGFHNLTADQYAYLLAGQTGDASATDAIRAGWMKDASAFAHYLASINTSWTELDLNRVLQMDVDRTLSYVEARRAAEWDADVADYEMVIENTGVLANTFAGGLAAAFPNAPH